MQPIGQLLAPIATVAVPMLARVRGDRRQYSEIYYAMTQITFLITVPGMIVCSLFPTEILVTLLSKRWVEAAPVFALISLGGIPSALYASATWLFISQERVGEMTKSTLIGAVANIAAFLIGARFGLTGIAAGGALSFIFVNLPITSYFALRSGPISKWDLFRLVAYQYLWAGVAALGLSFLRGHFHAPPGTRICIAICLSYGIIGAACLLEPTHRKRLIKVSSIVRGRSQVAVV